MFEGFGKIAFLFVARDDDIKIRGAFLDRRGGTGDNVVIEQADGVF